MKKKKWKKPSYIETSKEEVEGAVEYKKKIGSKYSLINIIEGIRRLFKDVEEQKRKNNK